MKSAINSFPWQDLSLTHYVNFLRHPLTSLPTFPLFPDICRLSRQVVTSRSVLSWVAERLHDAGNRSLWPAAVNGASHGQIWMHADTRRDTQTPADRAVDVGGLDRNDICHWLHVQQTASAAALDALIAMLADLLQLHYLPLTNAPYSHSVTADDRQQEASAYTRCDSFLFVWIKRIIPQFPLPPPRTKYVSWRSISTTGWTGSSSP